MTSADPQGIGAVPTLSVQEAAQRLDGASAVLLVDVRERYEYQALRAVGTFLLPMSELSARFGEIPADRSVMLICQAGARSARATAFLRQLGHADASNVAGGMIAWQAAGLPTRSGPLQPGEGELPSS